MSKYYKDILGIIGILLVIAVGVVCMEDDIGDGATRRYPPLPETTEEPGEIGVINIYGNKQI
jgi:hypothetical protein